MAAKLGTPTSDEPLRVSDSPPHSPPFYTGGSLVGERNGKLPGKPFRSILLECRRSTSHTLGKCRAPSAEVGTRTGVRMIGASK